MRVLCYVCVVMYIANARLLYRQINWHLAQVYCSLVHCLDLCVLLVTHGFCHLARSHLSWSTTALQAPEVLLLHVGDTLALCFDDSCHLLLPIWNDSWRISRIHHVIEADAFKLLQTILYTQIRSMVLLCLC